MITNGIGFGNSAGKACRVRSGIERAVYLSGMSNIRDVILSENGKIRRILRVY